MTLVLFGLVHIPTGETKAGCESTLTLQRAEPVPHVLEYGQFNQGFPYPSGLPRIAHRVAAFAGVSKGAKRIAN